MQIPLLRLALILFWMGMVVFLSRLASGAGLPEGGECVVVEGERIVAGDVAKAVPAFHTVLPERVIGFAPLPGARRFLTREELRRLGRREGVDVGVVSPACFVVRTEALQEEELVRAVRTALSLKESEGRIELLDYSKYVAPRGRIEFPPVKMGPGEERTVLLRGRVWYGERRSAPVWARVTAGMPGVRVVAAEALAAGKPIPPDQLRVRSAGGGEAVVEGTGARERLAGMVPRRTIQPGTAVEASMLVAPKEVTRGDLVEVEVLSGGARLRLPAKADSGGRRGENIVLVNPQSGQRFRARVEGPGKVAVTVEQQNVTQKAKGAK